MNPFKSDSFILGLVFLDLIIGKAFKNKITGEKKLVASLDQLFEYLLKTPFDEDEKRWYYKHIFKKMLTYDSSKRPDFIELYYSITNKNRRNVSNHILFDFLTTQNLLDKYMIGTKSVLDELFPTCESSVMNKEEKKEGIGSKKN